MQVTDLVELERIIQRLGRHDRFDTSMNEGKVIVISHFTGNEEIDELITARDLQLCSTVKFLKSLNGDISYLNLHNHEDVMNECYSKIPDMMPLTDQMLNQFSTTSIKDLSNKPPIMPLIHGLDDGDEPETTVVWREELDYINEGIFPSADINEILEIYPINHCELLRDKSQNVIDLITKVAIRDVLIWIHDSSTGKTTQVRTDDIIDKKITKDQINQKTIILPTTYGGMSITTGSLDSYSETEVEDVSGHGGGRMRIIRGSSSVPENMTLIKTYELNREEDETDYWDWYEDTSNIVESTPIDVTYDQHIRDVTFAITKILESVSLSDDIKQCIYMAAIQLRFIFIWNSFRYCPIAITNRRLIDLSRMTQQI